MFHTPATTHDLSGSILSATCNYSLTIICTDCRTLRVISAPHPPYPPGLPPSLPHPTPHTQQGSLPSSLTPHPTQQGSLPLSLTPHPTGLPPSLNPHPVGLPPSLAPHPTGLPPYLARDALHPTNLCGSSSLLVQRTTGCPLGHYTREHLHQTHTHNTHTEREREREEYKAHITGHVHDTNVHTYAIARAQYKYTNIRSERSEQTCMYPRCYVYTLEHGTPLTHTGH